MKRMPFLLAFAFTCMNLARASSGGVLETSAGDTALREQGKKIFVERCAQCHDVDAARKLPDGTTLLQRLAANKDPESRLGTRLKQPQERHAVMIYIEDLLKSSNPPAANPVPRKDH